MTPARRPARAPRPARVEPAPRYYRVYVALRTWVRDGTYRPGAQVPTEAELCRMFGVSRITVRKALEDLVHEGWLVRRQGRGTFVALSAARAPATLAMSQVADLGAATRVRDVRVAQVLPDEETFAALGLKPGERVQQARHVRVLKGVPLGMITTYIPLDIAARVGQRQIAGRHPVFELLERAGIDVHEADQWVGATLAGLDVGRALGVEIGAPLLRIVRVVFDAARRPVERVVALYRADAYQYRMRLERTGVRRGGRR
jgi:GntR family transcriptional regulator